MINPPTKGPTAGPSPGIREAMPVIKPIFSSGACSNTILYMSGSAMPVPMA